MNETYSVELERQLNKKLRKYSLGLAAAAIIGISLIVVVVAMRDVTIPVTVVLGSLTTLMGAGSYILVQHRILPLYCADQLMKRLCQKQPEPFEGIFRGFAEGKVMHSGVMMHKLRLDEGKRVGKEKVYRELSIPAVFEKPRIEEGTAIRGETVESVVVASRFLPGQEPRPAEGKYQVSTVAVLAIMAGAALLWGSIYAGINRQSAASILNIAVCTPAHHEDTQSELEQVMTIDGAEVAFSYTNTLDAETVAMYLATFGSMDADILVLNADQFSDVFENEAHPLDAEELEKTLGLDLRFVTDAAGQCTGVVLYDPNDPDYNTGFPRLIDWIAVEKDVALVAAIRYDSAHIGNGQANLALVQLLAYLTGY